MHHSVADAPVANAASQLDSVPHLGVHQAGVVNARPANGMVASFDVLARDADELEALFRTLTARIAFLTVGGSVPVLDPKLPPVDPLLGPVVRPDNLTITISLGASLFDDRPWLASLKPKHLERMMRFPNDALDADLCHGDLSIQICANTQDTTIHALRDIIKASSRQMILKWKQEGNVPVITPGPMVEPRAPATSSGSATDRPIRTSDAAEMDRVVWVGQAEGEPAWQPAAATRSSASSVISSSAGIVRPSASRSGIMGRTKLTGAPLDRREGSEFDVPDYVRDPEGKATPMDAHIRLANARDEASKANIILRRPFNYSNGVTRSGQLDQGLLFICYQADIERGFVAVQRKLNGEPLEEYIKPVGGGFFFTLPGIRDAADYAGSSLIAAARGA